MMGAYRRYFTSEYLTAARLGAYAYQFHEVMALAPQQVLEVGVGKGLLTYMLRAAGVEVVTLDVDAEFKPDVTASVTAMPLADASFDVVACFEVLEHLPFDRMESALRELYRVSRGPVVLSLPDAGRCLRFYMTGLGGRKVLWELPWTKPRHIYDGEHYWEINKKGYELKRIIKQVAAVGFAVEKTYRIWEFPYHRIFVLGKQSPSGLR